MRVVFEAGTHSLWVYRLLERLGHEALMADTHRLALITQSLSKGDERDAATLGELGLRMPQMLNPVQPCSLETQQDRTLLRAREGAVAARTKLINLVRGTVKSFGERLPKSGTEAFAKKAGAAMPASLRETLSPLLLVIQHLSDEIRRYDKKIEQLGEEKYPQTRRMRSIRGVGPITSLAFVLNLDNDATKLKSSRAAGPRMGLRPKKRDSGKSPAAEHHQERRPDAAEAIGAMCAVRVGTPRHGLGAAALGLAIGGAGRQGSEAQGGGGGGAQVSDPAACVVEARGGL